MKRCFRACHAALLLLSFEEATLAHAQVAAAGRNNADIAQEPGDIVITAQRRSERLQNVPIAVTAISGTDLAAAGVRSTESLAQVTPGLEVGRSKQALSLYLRGVGVNDNSAGNENSTAFYVDGVYISSAAAAFLSFNNIERVEVLKGPQGTLFGRNATGGLVQVVTRDPAATPGAEATLGYGNYDSLLGNAYLHGGLATDVTADLAVLYEHRGDGFGRNLFTGDDINRSTELAIRSKLVFKPGADTTLHLTADYVRNDGQLVRQIIPGSIASNGTIYPGNIQDANLNTDPPSNTTQYGLALNGEHDLGWASLVSITALRETRTHFVNDQDATSQQLVDGIIHERTRTFSQEVQLVSPSSSRIKWIAGLYYYDAFARYAPLRVVGLAIAPLAFSDINDVQKTRSLAAFGQIVVPLGNLTNLTVGGRYTDDRRTFDAQSSTNLSVAPPIAERTEHDAKPTFRVSLDHKVADDILVYASFNRGFKSGLFNLTVPTAPAVKPETLDAYEIGLKSAFFDRKLTFNLSAFYYDYSNLQVQVRPAASILLLNAEKAEIYGADADIIARPTSRFSLRGGFSLLHAGYKTFSNGPVSTPRVDAMGNPSGGNILSTALDLGGNEMLRAPGATVNVAGDYRVPFALGELGLDISYYHNSGFFWEPDNRLRQRPYDLVNATLSWTAPSGSFGVELWVKNLFDVDYYDEQSSNAFSDVGTPAPPRTFGARLSVKI